MWIHLDEYKAVGEILVEFRRRAGLRQQDVAARLFKPQSFVSAYEAGQRRIDILELVRIAAALNADPSAIFAEILRRRG